MNHRHAPSPRDGARGTSTAFRALLGVALGAITLVAGGCYARTRTRAAVVHSTPTVYAEPVYAEPVHDEPVVVVQTVPSAIEAYPAYRYRGSYVYLVDGRWYTRARGRWVVFRHEPRELTSVRVSYEARYGRHYRPRNDAASPPQRRHHRHDRR